MNSRQISSSISWFWEGVETWGKSKVETSWNPVSHMVDPLFDFLLWDNNWSNQWQLESNNNA